MTGPVPLPPAGPDRCRVCRRRAGMADAANDRFGWPDQAPDVPVGELEVCPDCGLLACPDCLSQGECCEYAGVERAGEAAKEKC